MSVGCRKIWRQTALAGRLKLEQVRAVGVLGWGEPCQGCLDRVAGTVVGAGSGCGSPGARLQGGCLERLARAGADVDLAHEES